jgi:hypothetical protein
MGPNFVVVKFPDPLTLLVETFSDVHNLLAEYLASHADNEQLWNRAYGLFEIPAKGNALLEALLADMLEGLSVDNALVQKLARNLGPAARSFL